MASFRPAISIAGHQIGKACRPFVIAEISGNHNGSLDKALSLIEAAKSAGADAVKIQTYTPDTMTIDSQRKDFLVEGGLWDGKTLYELYQWAHTPWEWHEALFAKAKEQNIILFSSPFDETAVDLLESLHAPAYKIASFEMTDLPLIEYVAKTGKPVIVSTGMANAQEIHEAVECIKACGNEQLVLLHCVSSYPASHEDANLSTLVDMATRFEVPTGLSDHTLDNTTAIAATALGACVIEKHFTDSRENIGPDSAFSLELNELENLVNDVQNAWRSLGKVNYDLKAGEKANVVFRRSLYAVKDIVKGERFTEANVRRIRPGYGLPPKYMSIILGANAPHDIKRGEPIDQSILEKIG